MEVTMTPTRIKILALVITVLSIASVLFLISSHLPKALVDVTVSPKWVNQAQFAGVFVAQDKGIYTDHGLTVRVHEFTSSSTPLEDILKGRSQFGYMSAQEYLKAYSEGNSIVAVAAFYQVSPFVIASFPIKQISSPRDLKGKILGIKGGPGAESESIYSILLNSAGLSLKDVSLKYLPFGTSELEDLQAGKVDVIGFYRTDQTYEFEHEGTAYTPIYPEQYATGIYNDVLVVTKAFAAAHPEEVRNFIKSTQAGWSYAFAHKDAAVATTLSHVTSPVYTDAAKERFILDASEPLIQPTPETVIGSMDLAHWQRLYDVLHAKSYLMGTFDVKDAFTNKFLQ